MRATLSFFLLVWIYNQGNLCGNMSNSTSMGYYTCKHMKSEVCLEHVCKFLYNKPEFFLDVVLSWQCGYKPMPPSNRRRTVLISNISFDIVT